MTIKKQQGVVGIVGARNLPYEYAEKVGDITQDLIERGYKIATGGAIGADEYALYRLVREGFSDQGIVFSPWRHFYGFPVKVRALVRQFQQYGGEIRWGELFANEPRGLIRIGLLRRNERLANVTYGVVAFLTAQSRGTIYTLKKALKNKQVVVVFCNNCELPEFDDVKWVPLRCGGVWENGFKAVYLI